MKKALSVLLILTILLIAAVVYFGQKPLPRSGRADVIVSTYALYDIARHLLTDEAEVQMLVPFGRDVHTFEPSPKDMARVERSRLFLYSGAGLEPWAQRFSSFANAVDMSRFVVLEKAAEHADHHEEHEHGAYDPHYWLDIANMKRLVEAMAALFSDRLHLDPAVLKRRAAVYEERLDVLDALYRKRLSDCRLDTIVVGHNAFGYLAHRYGFHVEALSGLSSDRMPDAATMAALSKLVKSKGIHTVFYEAFVSDKLMRTLAKEAEVRVDVLQPLANITADEIGADYFHLMNVNLLKLHDAMECR